jgi:hypothetical protein
MTRRLFLGGSAAALVPAACFGHKAAGVGRADMPPAQGDPAQGSGRALAAGDGAGVRAHRSVRQRQDWRSLLSAQLRAALHAMTIADTY